MKKGGCRRALDFSGQRRGGKERELLWQDLDVDICDVGKKGGRGIGGDGSEGEERRMNLFFFPRKGFQSVINDSAGKEKKKQVFPNRGQACGRKLNCSRYFLRSREQWLGCGAE